MNKYQSAKEEARKEAIEWQIDFSQSSHYMSKLVEAANYFARLAKRYGLIKEFRENGII